MGKVSLDNALDRATARQDDGTRAIPGAAFVAIDTKKGLIYSKASGSRTLSANGTDFALDGLCFIASMTKLMTSIAAMQAVERGLIGLDDDVSNVLHEWKDAQVLDGFDKSGEPMLHKAKNKITLRLLLSHSSGISYDIMDPRLMQWRKSLGQEVMTLCGSIDAGYKAPLVYEPGEGWAYGAGIDWAGRLVERLNGNIPLGEYMEKNIWGPMGMTSTTFNIEENPSMQARRVDMSMRMPTGELELVPAPVYPSPAQDDCGGIGGYSTAPDYMKLLTALLHADAKLLKSSSIDEMFEPQLPDSKYLEQVLKVPEMRNILAGNFPEGLKVNFGLGGMLNMEPFPSGRRKGAMQWGGMPNLFWWVDRESAICGAYFSQVMPMGDRKSIDLFSELETELIPRPVAIYAQQQSAGHHPVIPAVDHTPQFSTARCHHAYVD
ncbi:hypothetical protein V501_04948 [Pseudogymnoascus sp. VKM F-4519 (FW-2642)]|nr:hypothetical protein V501_04948 [Pseudogymnoascus sp. VKM F-4519 (FW-2642)]